VVDIEAGFIGAFSVRAGDIDDNGALDIVAGAGGGNIVTPLTGFDEQTDIYLH